MELEEVREALEALLGSDYHQTTDQMAYITSKEFAENILGFEDYDESHPQ